MRHSLVVPVLLAALIASPAGFSQAGDGASEAGSFDPRDLTGVWRGTLYAFGNDVPPFTADGQQRFEANRPSYGRMLGSADAAAHPEEHIGRRRAIPPALNNDPVGQCNPLGLIRLLLYAPAPIEIVQLPNRMIQFFEWTWDHREVWTDGRALPEVDDYLPRFNGYSVGEWDGDVFVVETVGLDERAWIDHFGYPLSQQARLRERWRRIDEDTLELRMTLTDPMTYMEPWVSDPARYRRVSEDFLAPGGWASLIEDRCVPVDESQFNTRVRDPAGGVGE